MTQPPQPPLKTTPKESFDMQVCPRHPDIMMKVFIIPIIGTKINSCSKCTEEKENAEKQNTEQKKSRELQSEIDRRIQNSAISPRFKGKTLSNWRADFTAQHKVMQQVENFLQAPTSTGLIFCGRPGTGKNHLACAIAKHFIIEFKQSALVTTVFKMVRAIKESWRGEGDEAAVIKRFVDVQMLVIDEIGVQFESTTEMLYLQEIINDRYEWERPTILISNKTPTEITSFLGERIIDRFRDGGHIVVFDWDSYRGK